DLAQQSGLSSFPLGQMRTALRHALGTWTANGQPRDVGYEASFSRVISVDEASPKQSGQLPVDRLARIAANLSADLVDKLLLGFPKGPFVLVLQPDAPDAFDAFLRRVRGDVPVHIGYANSGDGSSGEWAIMPLPRRAELIVRFGIPPLLDAW